MYRRAHSSHDAVERANEHPKSAKTAPSDECQNAVNDEASNNLKMNEIT